MSKCNNHSVSRQRKVVYAPLAAVIGLLGAYCTPAMAQDSAQSATTSAESPQSSGLSDIVVTANRRSENIQKVPISVTAISDDAMEKFKVLRPEDLTKMVPGLAAIPYAGTAVSTYSIRGVGQADAAEHEEQPVAIYQDGVYVANSAAAGFPIFDVQRSEVLRGPQGTLFGRNATGGLIQFISNQPKEGFSGSAEAEIGDYNEHRLQGVVNAGNDKIAGRLAIYHSTRDGFIKNLNGPDLASENVFALRGQVKINIDADTSFTLRAEGFRAKGTSYSGGNPTPAYYGADGYPALVPANVDIYGTGAGKDLYGYRNTNGIYTQSVNDPGLIYKRARTLAGTFSHDFGNVTLYSISSYADTLVHYREDTDGSPLFQTTYKDGADSRTITQELRLAKTTGSFRWTTGAYFFDIDGTYYTQYNLPTFCDPDSPNYCSLDRSASHLPLDAVNGKGASMQTDYTLHTTSYAAFGQAELDFTDRLTGILGVRYSYDDQKYSYLATCVQTIAGGCAEIYGVGKTAGVVSGLGLIHLSQNNGDWSGKAGLNYKLSDTALLYASASKGLKGGGYSTATDGNVLPGQLSFKPEQLYAYEVGVKTSFFDRKLTVNLGAFHYDYKNFQTFIFSGVSFSVVNRDATATGGELEVAARPLPGLTINGSLSYNDFLVDGIATPAAPGGEKQRAINAPKWTGSWGVTQELGLSKGLKLSLGYNGRYTGSRYFGIVNSPIVHGAAYTIHDLNVTLESDSGLSASVFVTNVTNKIYQTITFDQTFNGYQLAHYGLPRMFGASIKYDF